MMMMIRSGKGIASIRFSIAVGFILVFAALYPVLSAPGQVRGFELLDRGWVADYYPPFPHSKLFYQPDGTAFEGTVRGKEIGGGVETPAGSVVAKGADGWWRPSGDESTSPGSKTASLWLDGNGDDIRIALWKSIRERMGPAGVTGTRRYPVLLMEFSDRSFPPALTRQHYQDLLFGYYPTGSAKDFFYENSYGKLNFTGDVFGPFKVSQTMSYYGGSDDAGVMAGDLLPVADPYVNFANYTNSPGTVDMVIIIHAGLDEAATGNPDDIWSNSNPSWKGSVDGVNVCAPNTCAEDTEIGTVTHETGHSIGEPDYYDTSYKSMGTGEWDTMSGGTWLGDPPGSNPAHFNPLSKINYGWLTPKVVSVTSPGETLFPSESAPDIIKVPIQGSSQFFMLEYKNSSAGLFDRHIYNSGLVIWHRNPDIGNNNHPPNYMLDVEEYDYRDGTQELELNLNRAETTDVWLNDTTGMGPATSPNTKTSGASPAQSDLMFCSIGKPLGTMKLDIYKLSGMIDLSVDKPRPKTSDPVLAGKTVTLTAKVYNNGMTPLSSVRVRFYEGLPSDCVQIGGDVVLSSVPAYSSAIAEIPWTPDAPGFRVVSAVVDPDDAVPEACETNNAESSTYSTNFPGAIRVWSRMAPTLIVDDDSGLADEVAFEGSLSALGYPFITVEKSADYGMMSKFENVIWFTGSDRTKGALNSSEISGLKNYLDSGGAAWFSSPMLGSALGSTGFIPGVDPMFLKDYMGAKEPAVTQGSGFNITGMGDEIGKSDTYELTSAGKRPMTDTVKLGSSAAGTASAVFSSSFGNLSATKILGNGAHNSFRSVFFAFDLGQLDTAGRLKLAQSVLDWFRMSMISLDREFYWLDADRKIDIRVHDSDLNTDPFSAQKTTIAINSTSDPAGEAVELTEDGVDSSDFLGSVNISAAKSPGVLKVDGGDTVNATYPDTSAGRTRYVLASIRRPDFASFQLEYSTGWNLFSIPLAVNETRVENVLANISGTYDELRYYDSSDRVQPWKSYSPSKPSGLNTLTTLDRRMGIWIKMSTPIVLTFSGYRESTMIPLRKGWNLIGYPSLNKSRSVGEVFAGLPVELVQGYSALSAYSLRTVAFTEKMSPGQGYWVRVSADCLLKVAP